MRRDCDHDRAGRFGTPAFLLCLGLPLLGHFGCGPSQVVLDEQDRQTQKAYEQRSVAPPKKGRLSRIHEKRLKFEFGEDRPRPASSSSSPAEGSR